MTLFRIKLLLALAAGGLVGIYSHWLAGVFLFVMLATTVTLVRVRNEVRELRESFEDAS